MVRDRLREHAAAAGRLAPDGDPFGVAAKPADVLPRPAQRHVLIQQAGVGVRERILGDFSAREEPECVHAVVRIHEDEIARGGDVEDGIGRWRKRERGGPLDEASAVEGHDDGTQRHVVVAPPGTAVKPEV